MCLGVRGRQLKIVYVFSITYFSFCRARVFAILPDIFNFFYSCAVTLGQSNHLTRPWRWMGWTSKRRSEQRRREGVSKVGWLVGQ